MNDVSRRDFIKLFGVSIASLLLTRCKAFPWAAPTPTHTPTPTPTPRAMLRSCWMRFDELAQAIRDAGEAYEELNLDSQLISEHLDALNELVAVGELSQPVADLVREAYHEAIYHVYYSNIPVTCYEPLPVDYQMNSASILVRQAEILREYAEAGTLDPDTLAIAQAALEHDMAYIALSRTETDDLVQQIMDECQDDWECIPDFEELPMEPSADAKAAAQFIIELLTEP